MIKKLFSKKPNNTVKNLGNKKIVCIGGGTGLFSLLSGLKEYAISKDNIKAVVTTLDNGGSSGRLITQYGVLPPGDIRNCMVALSDQPKVVADLFQYRFDKKLDNHSFGNLLITALCDVTGSFDEAVKVSSNILRIRGEVVPVSLEKNDIVALLSNGQKIVGENKIDTITNKKIEEISLRKKTKANRRAVQVLKEADMIIFGPGDLYTSIGPNLLFPEIRNAIKNNKRAKKVLISPVMSKPGETDGFSVSHFISEIEKYSQSKLTHVISNTHVPVTSALNKYRKEMKVPVAVDFENIKGVKLICGNYIDEDKLVRHNPQKLAKAVLTLF